MAMGSESDSGHFPTQLVTYVVQFFPAPRLGNYQPYQSRSRVEARVRQCGRFEPSQKIGQESHTRLPPAAPWMMNRVWRWFTLRVNVYLVFMRITGAKDEITK